MGIDFIYVQQARARAGIFRMPGHLLRMSGAPEHASCVNWELCRGQGGGIKGHDADHILPTRAWRGGRGAKLRLVKAAFGWEKGRVSCRRENSSKTCWNDQTSRGQGPLAGDKGLRGD